MLLLNMAAAISGRSGSITPNRPAALASMLRGLPAPVAHRIRDACESAYRLRNPNPLMWNRLSMFRLPLPEVPPFAITGRPLRRSVRFVGSLSITRFRYPLRRRVLRSSVADVMMHPATTSGHRSSIAFRTGITVFTPYVVRRTDATTPTPALRATPPPSVGGGTTGAMNRATTLFLPTADCRLPTTR